jgi:hypothetical protein
MKFQEMALFIQLQQWLTLLPLLGRLAVLAAVAFASAALVERTLLQFRAGWVNVVPIAACVVFAIGTGLYLGDGPFAVLCGITVHIAALGVVELRRAIYGAVVRRQVTAENQITNR